MTNHNYIIIGKILSPRALKGEVHLEIYSNLDLFEKQELYLSNKNKINIKILSHSSNKVYIATINDIDSINLVKQYINEHIYIRKDALPLIDDQEDDFYYHSLIGLKVKDNNDIDGNIIGEITGVHNFGAGDILEIQFINQNSSELYGFHSEIFPVINLEKEFITFIPPETI